MQSTIPCPWRCMRFEAPTPPQSEYACPLHRAGRTSLGASQDLSRTALFQLMYSQMAVESLAARMQTAA